jgi:outer membrane protein insertion porin family
MSKKFLVWLALVFFAAAPFETIVAEPTATEVYDDKPVGNIEITSEVFSPTTSFDPKAIMTRFKTKVGDPFSQITFDSDLKMLSEDFDRIEPSIEVHNGQVYIQIKVWPRPNIRTMKWKGNEHIPTKTLQKELGVKAQAIFNRQGFNKAFNKVKEYYIKKGYFESQLQYTVFTDSKTNEVDIEIDVIEGRSGRIDNIIFEGFSKDEKSALLEMVQTKKYNLFLSWFLGTGTYDEEALEQDRLAIINYMQNEGYADAKISIEVKESPSAGKIILEVKCDKGPIFHFGTITFSGNKLFSDAQIQKKMLIQPGLVYSPEKIRITAENIKNMYGRKGYINTLVNFEAQLSESDPIYNISFTIDEGEQFKIGLIHVFGNKQTQANVILRESLLIPGQTFDSEKLKSTQMRLENIGYFKNVNVYAVRTEDDELLGENYRDVYIEVEETTTGSINLFGGFSTAENVFGGLDLSETNFSYKGLGRIFREGFSAVRGGGEYARFRFTIGANQRVYALSWMDPYFRDSLWRIGIDLSQTNSDLQADNYTIKTYGGTLYASYPLNSLWSFGTKYRVRDEHVNISGCVTPEERAARSAGVISGVGASLNFDSTDSATAPHNGFRSDLEGEITGLGGHYSFIRLAYINTFYKSVWARGILKFRFDAKFIEPYWKTNTFNQIPISERFFLGGENSVRGYKPFDLGPRFANGDPKGGISSVLLSAEYLQEIFSFLDAFIFFDAGQISDKRFRFYSKYNMSYGIGVVCDAINNIPIMIGYGIPINADSKAQEQRFFFQMGGQF